MEISVHPEPIFYLPYNTCSRPVLDQMPTLKLSGICPGAQMRRGRRRWPEAQLLTLQLVLATIATVTADALHGRQLAGDVFVASLLLIGALLALTLLSAAASAVWQVEKVCSSVSFGDVTFVSEDPPDALRRCEGPGRDAAAAWLQAGDAQSSPVFVL